MEFKKIIVIKCLELAIAIACIGLHYKTRTNDFDTDTLSAISYGGYIIILVGSIAGIILGTPMSRRVSIYFCLVGCAIFVASGALNISVMNYWSKSQLKEFGMSKAALSIINGGLLVVDTLLEWQGY